MIKSVLDNRFFRLALTVLVSVALTLFVVGVVNRPAVAPPAPVIAANTQSVNATTNVLLASQVTQSVTGTQVLNNSFIADCYEHLDLTGTQTVTVQLQHSADAVNWINLYAFAQVTHTGTALASTDTFTPATLNGSYLRAYATVAVTTAPVNASVLCTYH